jgi:hypothetical protein
VRIQQEECFDVLLTSDEAGVIAQEAVDEMLPVLKESLRSFALSAGWPIDVVDALDISYDGGILHIVCPESILEAVEDLEYGTETSSPNAVLRPFTIRADQYVGDVVGGRSVDYLLEQKVSI